MVKAFESFGEDGNLVFGDVFQDGFYHFFVEFGVVVVGFFAFGGEVDVDHASVFFASFAEDVFFVDQGVHGGGE